MDLKTIRQKQKKTKDTFISLALLESSTNTPQLNQEHVDVQSSIFSTHSETQSDTLIKSVLFYLTQLNKKESNRSFTFKEGLSRM